MRLVTGPAGYRRHRDAPRAPSRTKWLVVRPSHHRERHSRTVRLSGPVGRLVRRHRNDLIAAAESLGIRNLQVFGSVARGEDRPDNDVDLLADLPAGLSLLVCVPRILSMALTSRVAQPAA